MNEPRPTTISARPPEMRSSVAKLWNTRTGSAALSTATALVRRMRFVRAAAAARITAGAESRNSLRWWSPIPEDIQSDLVGVLNLLEQIAHAIRQADRDVRLTDR